MAAPIYKGGPPFFKPYLRFPNGIGFMFQVAGAPVSGTSGSFAGKAGPYSLLIDNTTGNQYQNMGTKLSPTWVAVLVPSLASSVLPSRETKVITMALVGTTIHSNPVGMVNPESVDVAVVRAWIGETHVATAAGTMDVGTTAVSIATASANLLDGIDVHSTAAPTIFALADQGGASGLTRQYWTAGTWITASDDAAGNTTGFIGTLYIEYFII